MGVYLSTPKTEKVSDDGENDRLRYGLSSMQGWRATMEDAHAAFSNLDGSTSFFGVYDGHGVLSVHENNGGKENVPSSSSEKPVAAFSAVRSNKKRKLRMPLEDITNLIYPDCFPSLQESASVIDASSVFLLAYLVYQTKNRCKRVHTSTLRNSTSAAATLRKHFR